ncbi:MAG: hypothetical protein JSR85_03910 [Proteobacteria bacterium]|nr:hypothetical protein [Pseudomonadota bacterium]
MLFSSQSIKNVATVLLCGTLLSGCSIFMALNGEKEPDISVVKKGASRTDVEVQLGLPIKENKLPNGNSTAIYTFEAGRDSSPGRAMIHGAADILTLGIWEAFASPIEYCKGDKVTLVITYDKEGHVISAVNTK